MYEDTEEVIRWVPEEAIPEHVPRINLEDIEYENNLIGAGVDCPLRFKNVRYESA